MVTVEVGDLPKLAAPARRALTGAGYTHLEQLARVTEADLLKLHGIGPTAMQTLRTAFTTTNYRSAPTYPARYQPRGRRPLRHNAPS